MKSTVSRIWAGAALVSVIVLAACPARWMAWTEFRTFVGIEAPQPDQPVDLAAMPLAHDRQAQIADAIDRDVLASTETILPSNRWPRLLALQRRYPGDSAILATLLRRQMQDLQIHVPASFHQDIPPNWPEPSGTNPKDFLNTLTREAETGESLDPENAYFPFVKAAVLFAGSHDREAMAAIENASEKPVWNEYLVDEEMGDWKRTAMAHRVPVSITDLELSQAIPLPPDIRLRDAAKNAAYHAMELEQQGKTADGLRVRLALLRLGSLMRSQQAGTIYTATIGVTIARIAIERPGGAPQIEVFGRTSKDDLSTPLLADFTRYLTQTGHAALIRPVTEEITRGLQTRDIIKHDSSQWDQIYELARFSFLWQVGITILQSVAILIAFSALARWLRPLAEGRTRRRAAYLALNAATGLLSPLPAFWHDPQAPWLIAYLCTLGVTMLTGGILIALFALALRHDKKRSRVICCGAATAFIISTVVWFFMFAAPGTLDVIPEIPGLIDVKNGETILEAVMWLPLIVPVFFGITATVFCLAKRVPLSSGVIRGFAVTGPRVACAIVILYAAFVILLNVRDQQIDRRVRHTELHEVATVMARSGQPWPGSVDWSGVKP